MTLSLQLPESTVLKPQITVFGVGGAGCNATNNMIPSLEGVNFVVANTDAQALENSEAEKRIQLGRDVTKGLGAGASPEVGGKAAEETIDEITEHLQGSNMVFITAGMGGGTGTGAAPVVAKAARALDILTVGVVTKPFHFEGPRRMRLAEEGLEELQKNVDTLIIIPNQNLFRVANERTTFSEAFSMADAVLHAGVRGITDLMVMPGLINLDFADVRSVMSEMGKAMMGTGEAEGEARAKEAAEAAISNPLLDNVSMKGARGVLINITGGSDMTLFEVDEAANRVREEVDSAANIIFGSTFNDALDGKLRVSVVATGIDAEHNVLDATTSKPSYAVSEKKVEPQPTFAKADIKEETVEEISMAVDSPKAHAPEVSTQEQTSLLQPSEPEVIKEEAPIQQSTEENIPLQNNTTTPAATTTTVAQEATNMAYQKLKQEVEKTLSEVAVNQKYDQIVQHLNREYEEANISSSNHQASAQVLTSTYEQQVQQKQTQQPQQSASEEKDMFVAPKAEKPSAYVAPLPNELPQGYTAQTQKSYQELQEAIEQQRGGGLFSKIARTLQGGDAHQQQSKTTQATKSDSDDEGDQTSDENAQKQHDELLDIPAFLRRKS